MKTDDRPWIAAILPAALAATTLWFGFGVAADAYAQDSRQHVVESGDTLFGIARTYGVTVEALRRVNRLSGDDIRVGQLLIVPEPEEEESAEPSAARDSAHLPRPAIESAVEESIVVPVRSDDAAGAGFEETTVTGDSLAPEDTAELESVMVEAGRSLYDVAFAVGVDIDSLISLNPDLPRFLDSTLIAVPAGQAVTTYRVRSGDTLYKIATEHGTTIEAIRNENRLSDDAIHVDQVLVIPSRRGGDVVSSEAPLVATGFVRPYPSRFEGRLMANGRAYEPGRFYVSHADLPFGSIVLLTSPETGSNVFAEVADRLPSNADYAMDVSLAVAMALDVGGKSNPEVEIRVVRYGSGK